MLIAVLIHCSTYICHHCHSHGAVALTYTVVQSKIHRLCELFCCTHILPLVNTYTAYQRNMQATIDRLERSLKEAQETIVSLEKERVVKDLQLLKSVAELKSLRNHLDKLIKQATEALQWVCNLFGHIYNLYTHIHILV